MKKVIILLSLICIYSGIYAQSKEVTILSPKAASIMKYGEHPVSLHTGLVDISVPVYTIEGSGVKIPIEFKYHASGLKYDDISNEIGLGWSLIAGGMITRSVRGAWDGEVQSYSKDITKIKVCDNDPSPLSNGYASLREVENGSRGRLSRDNSLGQKDGEMDMYSFSFLHHSGSFCFPFSESEVNESVPYTGLFIPNNGMKVIDRSLPNQRLELLDPDGIFYRFEVKDVDQNERYKEYYLTKVVSANKADTIDFVYDVVSSTSFYQRRPNINYSATLTEITPPLVDGGHSNGLNPGKFVTDNGGGLSYQELRPPRLIRINFRGGHIEFSYAIVNNITTWDLKEVRVYNNIQSSPIQTITLSKTLFSNGEKRLDKVMYTGLPGQSYDYQFAYNGDPGQIRPDASTTEKGIDYWGYYNGKNVPYGECFIPQFDNMPYGIYGTDRSTNESYMQKGILNKITYPTKGYSEFSYEAHKASYSWEGTNPQIFGGLRIKEIRNYLPDGTLAEKKWYKYGYKESGAGTANAFPNIEDFISKSRVLVALDQYPFSEHLCQIKDITTYSVFPKANYFISGSPVVYPVVTEYVGNNVTDYGKTIYSYEVALDEKFYPYSDTYRWKSPDVSLRTFPWETGQLSSKRVYKKEGSIYKEVYSVQNFYDNINVCEFRNVRVLPRIEFEYIITGNKPDIKTNFCNDSYTDYRKKFDENNSNMTPYDYFNYYTTTGLKVLSSTEETVDGVTSYTSYDIYNSNGLPTRVTRTSSIGDSLTSIFKYPTDFTHSIYTGMSEANILTPVIEKTNYKNGNQFIDMSITNYKYWSSRFYAPENSQVRYQNGITETRQKYDYDTKNNLRQIVKDDAEKVVYLWSYNYQYPVIEVKGASLDEVKAVSGSIESLASLQSPTDDQIKAVGSTLRTYSWGKPVLVTTYTYKPLVGMSSMTDPSGVTTTYEYDPFGRLQTVKDMNGNILNHYQYHYKNN